MKRGKPTRRPELLNQDDHVIISTFGSEYRGIVQYYLLAGRRLPTRPAAMGHGDLDADDAGQQAPLVGVEDGPQVRGHHRHTARAAQVLRSPRRTALRATSLAFADDWLTAFERTGQELRVLSDEGVLTRGIRSVCAHLVIFHRNRLGLPRQFQASLAKAAREVIFT
ncbi:hypothetical protein DQ384_39620 [Sphaerisporangium album]|uniref:Uncharacterized protein n=2 Tax=Sphaerisporangium album TaxID=509200 RepID=A0A367EK75_9ACTN|nr:hypothetical protein DQ384_39620 [Sphaerisporangium album]